MSQIFIKDEHDIGVADIKTEGNAANILGMLIQSVCSVARGIGLSKEKNNRLYRSGVRRT